MCPIWLPCSNPSNFILHRERMHTCMSFLSPRTSEFNFFSLFFLFSVRSRVVQVHSGVCVLDLKMHVKFPSNLLELNFFCSMHSVILPFAVMLWSPSALTPIASSFQLPPLFFLLFTVFSPLCSLCILLTLSSCISVSLALPFQSICLPLVYWGFFSVLLFTPCSLSFLFLFFSFASKPKMDLNGWGHG